MIHSNKKQCVVNSKDVRKAVNVACACVAVASAVAPAVSALGEWELSVPRLFRLCSEVASSSKSSCMASMQVYACMEAMRIDLTS